MDVISVITFEAGVIPESRAVCFQEMKINISAKNRSFVFAPIFNNITGRLTVNCVTNNKVDLNIKNIGVETAEPQSRRCDISVGDGSSLCSPVAHNCRGTLTINYYSQNDVLENFNSEERAEFQAQLVPPMGAPAPGELIVNISAVNGSSIYSPVFNNCTGSLTINFFQVIRGKRCLCQESLLQEED
ncbi:uncharacterized protein LOC113656815 isoform X5 [Tachysurus fulvidraco]|uniref:uncharacterized protein LOC113656815 isoform X5 n=1 Tax=Tachysurus fulvidraco TaxID=1234273 RepID=UPI001FEF8CB9|nr:uncharacterized protein LOC113656815 isoform X5 [Tachysurus fulvidraco]